MGRHLRIQKCEARRFYRYRIVNFDRPGYPVVGNFLTLRGAKRYLERANWTNVER